MRNDVPDSPRSGCLIYDSHCRLCVAVKHNLERRAAHVQFIPYDSPKAAEYLGKSHQRDHRPPMAYWVDEQGTIVGGVEAFLPVLHGLTSGKLFLYFWRFRLCRQTMMALYAVVARYRYCWFGATGKPR